MEIREMTSDAIETRMAEIKELLNDENCDIDALTEEVNALEARKSELKELAEKRANIEELVNNNVNTVVIEEVKEEENRTMEQNIEVRNTLEYGQAFVKGLKSNDFSECRALLSTNVSTGTVPVPEFLENEIKNAWENCQIMSLVKKTNYKGNVKVGFELSATGAVVHVEGTDAPAEETLVWGVTELKAESIKKWITVSDEAIEGTTIDTLGEIVKEIVQRIVEKAEDIAIGKIISAPAASTATAAGVPVITASTIAADTIINAVALLSGKARNLNIAMNRQTYPAFVAVAMAANYAIDVFDGLKDKIVFTDALPAFSAASSSDTYAIIGDFGYGFQANFPSGSDMTIKIDDTSLAEKDLVKIVGRQYVGMGVVAPNAFVKINK